MHNVGLWEAFLVEVAVEGLAPDEGVLFAADIKRRFDANMLKKIRSNNELFQLLLCDEVVHLHVHWVFAKVLQCEISRS